MPIGGQLKELRIAMHRLGRMLVGGQLRELRATMHRLRQMLAGGQLKELLVAMRRLFWKMLYVLTPIRFCIPIGNMKHVTRIVRLTKANVSSCWKSVAKKFETLTVKHVMPNVDGIMLTRSQVTG